MEPFAFGDIECSITLGRIEILRNPGNLIQTRGPSQTRPSRRILESHVRF